MTTSNTRRSLSCLNRHQRLLYSISLEYSSGRQLQHANLVTRSLTSQTTQKSEVNLPASIVSALAIDEPVELVFLGEDRRRNDYEEERDHNQNVASVYLLALYSVARVWLIRLSSSSTLSCQKDMALLPDAILDPIIEPFEDLMLSKTGSSDVHVARIRSAQGSASSVSIVPSGSMAMLLSDGTLALYHHPRVSTGVSLPVKLYQLSNSWDAELDVMDPLVDFCFCIPDKDDALGELAILLLHQSGDVYGAAPICFDGTLIQRSTIVSSVSYLEGKLRDLHPPQSNLLRSSRHSASNENITNDAKWRQIKASLIWINDVFGDLSSCDKSSYYNVARLKNAPANSACFWPLQVQGPLLFGRTEIGDNGASCAPALHIESMPPSRSCPFTLFAVCRQSGQVDVCTLSSQILMRFELESSNDKEVLDETFNGSGAVLLSSVFDQGDEPQDWCEKDTAVTLIADPRSLGMIHVGTKKGVFSVSSGVVTGLEQWLKTKTHESSEPKFHPTAWSCLKVTGGVSVCGVTVMVDTKLGHLLYIQLSSGSIEVVNVKALQYLNAAAHLTEHSTSKAVQKSSKNTALDKLPQSFHRVINPLISNISRGISSVGKVTGNKTMPEDIGAAELATFLSVKSTLESEVMLPLKELSAKTETRKSQLEELLKNQKKELDRINGLIAQIRGNLSSIENKKKTSEENASVVAQRCAAVLEAGKDLMPTISQAESDYFNQLKRWETQCASWKESIVKLQTLTSNICDSWTENTKSRVELKENEVDLCNSILAGQGENLSNATVAVDKYRRKVIWEADRLGLEIDISS